MTEHEPHHSVEPFKMYFIVFGALLVFTGLTVFAALHDLGVLNTPVALTIATCKAALVILFFMHAIHSTRVTWVVIIGSFLWLGVMFVLTFADYLSRFWPVQ